MNHSRVDPVESAVRAEAVLRQRGEYLTRTIIEHLQWIGHPPEKPAWLRLVPGLCVLYDPAVCSTAAVPLDETVRPGSARRVLVGGENGGN